VNSDEVKGQGSRVKDQGSWSVDNTNTGLFSWYKAGAVQNNTKHCLSFSDILQYFTDKYYRKKVKEDKFL